MIVVAVATQGKDNGGSWVKSYRVGYSDINGNFKWVTNGSTNVVKNFLSHLHYQSLCSVTCSVTPCFRRGMGWALYERRSFNVGMIMSERWV